MKKIKEIIINERKLIIVYLIIIIAFSIINITLNRMDIEENEKITRNLYTLTEDSKEKIAQISDDKEIKIYLFNYDEEEYVSTFSREYEKLNKKISVENRTIQEDEELVEKYDIKDIYSILIVCNDKSQLLIDQDLYSYDFNTGNIYELTEQRLTNGIVNVASSEDKDKIYILKGHNKYNTEKEFTLIKRYVEIDNYEFNNVNLEEEAFPEDCKLLIINSLSNDLSDKEKEKIKKYIENGGNIFWLEDAYFGEDEFKNKKEILDIYGTEIKNNGVVFEQDKNSLVMQNPYLIVPSINSTEITKSLSTQGNILFYYSTKIDFADNEKLEELNVKNTELLYTSENALFKTDLSNDTLVKKENDEEGKFVVGALIEKKNEENTSKIIIYANNYFITNQTMKIGKEEIPVVELYNNKELIQNSINYLCEKNNLEIRKLVPMNYYIGIEKDTLKNAIITEIVFLVLSAGFTVLIKKKNK